MLLLKKKRDDLISFNFFFFWAGCQGIKRYNIQPRPKYLGLAQLFKSSFYFLETDMFKTKLV